MVENPRVLVASSTFEGMEYCHEQFINRLKSLSYDNYDILLVDNSDNNDFFKKLKLDTRIKAIRLKLEGIPNLKKIIRSRNKILNYAIMNSYDYILMMDADVIPPTDIIKRLLKHDKDIVSGIYFNVFNVDNKQKTEAVAWKSLTEEEFEKVRHKLSSNFIKSHTDVRRNLTEEEIKRGELQEVIIPSAGCMLISRDVFKKIRYGLLDIPDKLSTSDDIFFCQNARDSGFKLYCDTSLKCEHLISGKLINENGVLTHPAYE